MYALVDCNNFYASCERLFAPQFERKPVIVLSNNDGCVVARSEEAKALGIEMGVPAFMITEEINRHGIIVFSSNYTLYGSISDRVMHVLQSFTPSVELYSIDEAFLNFQNFKYTDLQQLAYQIRKTVKQHVGIPVTVGIAPTKVLAKMANRWAKKHLKGVGVYAADTPAKIADLLRNTAIPEIWGVGPQYSKLLAKHGLKTALELSQVHDTWIRQKMSVVGQRLVNELRGIPCIPLEEIRPKQKNICVSRSFGQLLTQKKDIQEALANYVSIIGRKLRKQELCARCLHVWVETNPFRLLDRQYRKGINIQLPVASCSSRELITYALMGLERVFKPGYNYIKTGCLALDLVPANQLQYGLFDQLNRDKECRLMKALDEINQGTGIATVRFGNQGYGNKWKLKHLHRSPRYTTRLNEILSVKI